MGGETEKEVSSWTVDSLKSHHDACLRYESKLAELRHLQLLTSIEYEAKLSAERDRRYAERFAAQEAATAYMRQVTNEFRGQLSDQQTTFITRTETLARAQSNADKIDALTTRIDRTEGRSGGMSAGWGYLVAAVGLAATVIAIFFALK